MCQRICRASLWRENINTIDRRRRKCSLQSAIFLTVGVVLAVLFAATNIVQWDTDITFTMPVSSDLNRPAGVEVSEFIMNTPEWQERKEHIIEALSSGCNFNSFSVTTHKNLRVMGSYVPEGIFYVCSTQKAYINVEMTPEGGTKYLCRESYGENTREVRRSPFRLAAVELRSMQPIDEVISAPGLICSIGHAVDVVRSNWYI